MNPERVLVIPKHTAEYFGLQPGLKMDDDVIPLVRAMLYANDVTFLERKRAEQDESYLQIIPYVLITCRDRVFTFVRGKHSTEARLRGGRAVGIGGHVNERDTSDPPFAMEYFCHAYCAGMLREIQEEVHLMIPKHEYPEVGGMVYDPYTSVGIVHVGIIHHVEVPERKYCLPRNHEITDVKWMSADEVAGPGDSDSWARICIPYLQQLFSPYEEAAT